MDSIHKERKLHFQILIDSGMDIIFGGKLIRYFT